MGSAIKLDAIGTKLTSQDAEFHKTTVSDILARPNLKFPGGQPVSFGRKHLRELERADYYVAEKTDGIRCLLFLTQLYPPDNQSPPFEAQFLIDRKNDYYHIPQGYLHIPPPQPDPKAQPPYLLESWHLGTILDGELVQQRFPDGKEQLTYLIFDLLALDTKSTTDRTYDTRIGKLENFVLRPWKAYAKDWPGEIAVQPFQLKLKRPELGYGVEMMFKQIVPNLPHGNDGLIFTCKETAYATGTDKHILKWKPPHENTVDFRLLVGSFPMEEDDDGTYEDFDQKPEMTLQVYHGDRAPTEYQNFAQLYVTDGEWEAMKAMGESFDCRIIECWRDAESGRWRPKLDGQVPRFRDDKEHGNHHSVVDAVIESIEDAVTEEELIACKDRFRDAWKERERQRMLEKEKEKQEQEKRRTQQQNAALKKPSGTTSPVKDETMEELDDGPGYVD